MVHLYSNPLRCHNFLIFVSKWLQSKVLNYLGVPRTEFGKRCTTYFCSISGIEFCPVCMFYSCQRMVDDDDQTFAE